MYDLPELRQATDAWWASLGPALRDAGFGKVPAELDRGEPLDTVWRDPDLLLSQCCGRDYVTHLRGAVDPVAIPVYAIPGCRPGTYRSVIVKRVDDARGDLLAFKGARAAVNYPGSHSGRVALAHALARAGAKDPFFADGVLTGAHRRSIAAVRAGAADLAAIDLVTWTLLAEVAPRELAGLEVLGTSEEGPALPFITRRGGEVSKLQQVLGTVAVPPELRLVGFLPAGPDSYRRSEEMAAAALPTLCGSFSPWTGG